MVRGGEGRRKRERRLRVDDATASSFFLQLRLLACPSPEQDPEQPAIECMSKREQRFRGKGR